MDDNAAHMITHVKVNDEEKWDEYRSQVPTTLSGWGTEVVFRGKRADILTGRARVHPHDHHPVSRRGHDP